MSRVLQMWEGMTGTVLPFAAASAPDGWLLCHGQAVSRTTYATLFAKIGTTYGAGDGSTTFNVPDLRGEFVRGLDAGRGIDAGRTLGSAQGHALQNHNHYLPTAAGPGSAWGVPDEDWMQGDVNHLPTPGNTAVTISSGGNSGNSGTFAGETRPRNIALNHIIKT